MTIQDCLDKYLGDTIYVSGKPIPLARPRMWNNKCFDTQKVEKRLFARAASLDFKKKPYDVALSVYMFFGMPIATSLSKKKQQALIHSPHLATPDLDNLVKFVCDALNGIVWSDDKLIHSIKADKYYACEPHTRIIVVPNKLNDNDGDIKADSDSDSVVGCFGGLTNHSHHNQDRHQDLGLDQSLSHSQLPLQLTLPLGDPQVVPDAR